MSDLFDSRWELEELRLSDLGPWRPGEVSDERKEQIWAQYWERKPRRVPMLLGLNNRVALLDHRVTAAGLTYERVFSDPEAMLKAQLLFQYVARKRYHHFCDYPTDLPDVWRVQLHFQNVYEAMFFGCPINFHPDQVPDTTVILNDENKHSVFDIDIARPLERDPFRTLCQMTDFLMEYVKDKTFLDRPIEINPNAYLATDGPLTVGMNLRGPDIIFDMIDDPDYADTLFRFIVEASLLRRQALMDRYYLSNEGNCMADDSIALISTDQYQEMLLPHHQHWYDSTGSTFGKRGIHLCGDATRHFPVLKEKLGIVYFDTGFPVDFGWLRKTLGAEVEIAGGVEVGTLLSGTPEQVYRRSQDILTSGILAGGRFIFREGNNLPPNVPWVNLAAMYKAVQDFGTC